MGLFSSSQKKLSLKEIEDIIDHISSLDHHEKDIVLGAFASVSHSGISKEEFKKVIRELRESRQISEIDYDHLKDVWEEKY